MNQKPISFARIEVTKAELDKLPVEERGAFIAAALAANQIGFLWRMHILASYDDQVGIPKEAAATYQLMLTRELSAAVVEFVRTVGRYLAATKAQSPHHTVIAELKAQIENPPEFGLARQLRNRSTNHFDFQEMALFLDTFSPEHKFELYEHRAAGNSFYPFAEEIAMAGELQQERSAGVTFEAWHTWVREASEVAISIQKHVAAAALEPLQFEVREVTSEAPSVMIFDEDQRLPLFFIRKSAEP